LWLGSNHLFNFFYDETTPFPSVYALVPVLGVVLLLLFADKETLAAKVLSTKGFVGIGLISYSVYLWHQPLFAFAKIRLFEPTESIYIILCITSIALAYLTWRYVETPFRGSQSLLNSQVSIFTTSVIFLASFTLVGIVGHINKMSEWLDNQKKPTVTFASKLLQERIEKAFANNPRRKLTAEETKRLNKLEAIADKLKRGENVQNRQLQTWLSEEEYEQLEYEWQEQLELRKNLKTNQAT
jgi:preprotein translocase subunit Sss1